MVKVKINCKKSRKLYLYLKEKKSKQNDWKLHKIVHCLEKIQYGQTEGQMNKQKDRGTDKRTVGRTDG